jgi:hypothetical protein
VKLTNRISFRKNCTAMASYPQTKRINAEIYLEPREAPLKTEKSEW